MINHLDKLSLGQKKVLLQLDFEQPLENFRPTIEHLVKNSASIIVIGTLNRETGLGSRVNELADITGRAVSFLSHSVFEKSLPGQVATLLDQGQIVLLENLAFYPEERKGDSVLAQALSRLADIYVNEAFRMSHRNYASLVQLPDFLESAGGLNLMEERRAIAALEEKDDLAVILGGDKITESLELAFSFLAKANHILVSGKIAEAIFRVKGISPGKDWPEDRAVRLIKKLDLTDSRLHLPVDVVTGPKNLDDSYRRVFAPGEVRKEDDVYDIGPETIRLFSEIIGRSQALVWRGPLGLHSWPEFGQGTRQIAESILTTKDIYSVVGGRETISFLRRIGQLQGFSHVSSGGESMMRLAAGQELPALRALSSDKLIG